MLAKLKTLAVLAGLLSQQPFQSVTPRQRLVDRVRRYRAAGSLADGPHLLFDAVKIDATDYALMGADNSCARIKSDEAPPEHHSENRWFAIARSWTDAPYFYNHHGASEDGGKTFYIESALLSVPRAEYQASPEEVVWHYLRVRELTEQGVEQARRIEVMTGERAARPWQESPVVERE